MNFRGRILRNRRGRHLHGGVPSVSNCSWVRPEPMSAGQRGGAPAVVVSEGLLMASRMLEKYSLTTFAEEGAWARRSFSSALAIAGSMILC